MPALSPVVPLLFVLFTSAPVVAQPSSGHRDVSGVRRIELRADAPGEGQVVRISQGRTTTLLFDMVLLRGWVELEGRELFRLVSVGEDGRVLTLLPAGELEPGRQLRLRVRFADSAVPTNAEFLLVVHPALAEQQVEVYRQPNSAESYRQEAREARTAAERCEAELARMRGARELPDGLTGMLEAGLMNGEGVTSKLIWPGRGFTRPPGEVLEVGSAMSYRARGRMALDFRVRNPGEEPWRAAGAEWVGEGGARLRALRVRNVPEPVSPGQEWQRVVVEAEWVEDSPRGPYTLRLWEESGARSVTLMGFVVQ